MCGMSKLAPSKALVKMTWFDQRGNHEQTYKEYVEIGQRKPGKEQIERIVGRLDHESQLAHTRVIGPPDLRYVYQRIHLIVSHS